MSNPTYIEKRLNWTSGVKFLPLPWSNFTFLSDKLLTEDFFTGNPIITFQFTSSIKTDVEIKIINTAATTTDTATATGTTAIRKAIPARIGAIVYNTDITYSKDSASTAVNTEVKVPINTEAAVPYKSRAPYPIGFILVDEAGEIIAVPLGGDSGTASFYVEVTDTTDQDILCFFKLVWQEQCEFAKCTLNYLNLLQFGAAPCDALDELMNKRRALEILNCYDVRDIPNNTTDYNVLTYTQIKNLLNS